MNKNKCGYQFKFHYVEECSQDCVILSLEIILAKRTLVKIGINVLKKICDLRIITGLTAMNDQTCSG